MSTFIQSYNNAIFGPHNPFRNYLTEPGLKNTFFHLMIDKSSKIYKSKSWRVYCLANKIFPNKVAEIDEHVKHGIGKLLDPFINTNIQNLESSVLSTSKQSYYQGEITLSDELSKATGIKNCVAIVADCEKEHCGTRHGIITYLTRNMTNGVTSDLEPTWSNKFFKFTNPGELSLLVVVPKQYLISLIQNVVSNTSNLIDNKFTDKIVIKSNLVDEFSIDLVKSIFTSIYSDGIRNRVNSDILLVNSLLQKEGLDISSSVSSSVDAEHAADKFQKYQVDLKQFKKTSNDEHLIYNIMQFNSYNHVSKINPLEFYTAFIDTPYVYMEDIFAKCQSFQRLTNQSINYLTFNYSNNLLDMDTFAADKEKDVVIFGLKLVRYLPFLLFNTYVIGGGNAHNETRQIIDTVKKTIPYIMGFKASNNWTAPIVNFIVNNLEYITETLFTQLSSPLTVSSASTTALTFAITKYGIVPDSLLDGITNPDDSEPVVSQTEDDA